MKSTRTFLVLLFLAATIAAGLFAFREYKANIALTARLSDPKTGLESELADARRQLRELRDQLALSRKAAASAVAARENGPEDGAPGGPPADNSGRPNRRAAFEAILSSPQFQALRAVQAKSQLDARYADLFKTLVTQYGLSPAQIDQFKGLLVQRQQAMTDAMQAARQNGINPRTDPQAFQQAIAAATSDLDTEIKTTLGDAAYSQYQQYNQTSRERATVTQLQQSLSYTTPLSDAQAQQLTALLQQQQSAEGQNQNAQPGRWMGPMAIEAGFIGGPGATSPITPQVLTQAATFLSPAQVQALQQLQQVQQASQQMQQMMRATFQGNRRGGG